MMVGGYQESWREPSMEKEGLVSVTFRFLVDHHPWMLEEVVFWKGRIFMVLGMFRVPLQFLYAYCTPLLCDSGQTKKSLLESRDLVIVFGQTFSAEKGQFLKQLHLPRQIYFIIWFKCENSPAFQIGNFHRIIFWWMFHIPRAVEFEALPAWFYHCAKHLGPTECHHYRCICQHGYQRLGWGPFWGAKSQVLVGFGVQNRTLTWQWKSNHLKMYLLLNTVIFHWHVSFGVYTYINHDFF